jgi:hypothetical protein
MRDTTTIAVAAAAAFFLMSELNRFGVFDGVAAEATTMLRPTSTAVAQATAVKCTRQRATLIVVAREPCDAPTRHPALASND